MNLQELRSQWEEGRTILLAVSNPNRDKVYVLLHNQFNKNDIREEYSVFEYSKTDDKWTMYINPNLSEFEHIEQGLEYINFKFEEYLPVE